MRIAFCGASGTGKSKLTKHVAEKYGLSVCPVGSRSVALAMGFENPYDVDAAGKRVEFQRRLFEEKRAWEADHEDFVTDRTPFDNLAYATMHGARMQPEEIQKYVAAMSRYDEIIYLPLRFFQNLGGDPHRVPEQGYHEMFDLLLCALLMKHYPNSTAMCIAAPESRIDAVDSLIANHEVEYKHFRAVSIK